MACRMVVRNTPFKRAAYFDPLSLGEEVILGVNLPIECAPRANDMGGSGLPRGFAAGPLPVTTDGMSINRVLLAAAGFAVHALFAAQLRQ